MSNPSPWTELASAISTDRLGKYLLARNGNLAEAIKLHAVNMKVSEAFYSPLQTIEICLRNKINEELIRTYGPDWPINKSPPFQNDSVKKIHEVVQDFSHNNKNNPSTSDIVAGSSFGFWVSLLGPRYDANLWRGCLHRAFREHGKAVRRDRVHGRLNAIRRFRNRVAHHEPIFTTNLANTHAEIIEAIGWMCPTTSSWTMGISRFPQVMNELSLLLASPPPP